MTDLSLDDVSEMCVGEMVGLEPAQSNVRSECEECVSQLTAKCSIGKE